MKTISHLPKPIQIDKPSIVIPREEYESLIETLEILSDKKLLLRIESAIQNIRKGKIFSHKEVFGHTRSDKI